MFYPPIDTGLLPHKNQKLSTRIICPIVMLTLWGTFFYVILSSTTKFCNNWERRTLVFTIFPKFVYQNMCKITKSSYFLWRHKIEPERAMLIIFVHETHRYSLIIVCAKFRCDRVRGSIVLDLRRVTVLYSPIYPAALQKSWIHNPLEGEGFMFLTRDYEFIWKGGTTTPFSQL